jgi:hypothetical protein
LLERLAHDLSARLGKGFSRQNLQNMRKFYLAAPPNQICQPLSGKLAETKIAIRCLKARKQLEARKSIA